MSRLSQSLRGFGGTLASSVAIAALGLVGGVIAARTLGAGGRGDLAAAIQWASVTLALGDMGLGMAIAHQAGASPRKRGELWGFALAVSFIWGGLILVATANIFPDLVHRSAALALKTTLWVTPFGLALGFQAYLLLGSGRVLAHNCVRLSAALTYAIGVGALTLWRPPDAAAFGLVFVLSQALGALVGGAILARNLRPTPLREPGMFRALVRFGIKSQTAAIASIATLRLDQLLLSLLVPPDDLGRYVVAVAAASLAGPLFNAAAIIVMPRLNTLSDSREATQTIWRELGRALFVCVPVVVAAFAAMPLVLRVLFGLEYSSCVPLARLLIVASLFQGANAVLGNSMRATGRPGVPAIAEAVGMLATVFLLLVLLPVFGTLGAAVASLISYGVVTTVYIALLSRKDGAPRHHQQGQTVDS